MRKKITEKRLTEHQWAVGLQLTNICATGVPKKRSREIEKLFEETMAVIFINWTKAINLQYRSMKLNEPQAKEMLRNIHNHTSNCLKPVIILKSARVKRHIMYRRTSKGERRRLLAPNEPTSWCLQPCITTPSPWVWAGHCDKLLMNRIQQNNRMSHQITRLCLPTFTPPLFPPPLCLSELSFWRNYTAMLWAVLWRGSI